MPNLHYTLCLLQWKDNPAQSVVRVIASDDAEGNAEDDFVFFSGYSADELMQEAKEIVDHGEDWRCLEVLQTSTNLWDII